MGAFRLFLAALVALGHWQFAVLSPRHVAVPGEIWLGFNLYYAVLFFYVISGFLITYTLARNYEPTPRGAMRFYRKRAIRIFSLYWPLCIVCLATIPGAWPAWISAAPVDKFTSLSLMGSDWRWSFGQPDGQYASATLPGMPQAWSLGAELTFYLMAPFLMRSWRIAAAMLIASFALRMTLVSTFGPRVNDLWTYTFFPSTLVFFLIGHFAARIGQRLPALAAPKVGLSLTVTSAMVMALVPAAAVDALNFPAEFDSVRLWLSILLFAAGMPGLFNATKNIRVMNRMGDLTYPLYLVHVLVIMLAGPRLFDLAPSALGSSAVFLMTAVAASAAHCLLERPIARYFMAGSRIEKLRYTIRGA